ELLRIQTIHPLDLRNDFVAATFDVEAVDEIAADRGGHIGSHLLHVEAHRSDFVVIENNFGLWLVDLRVDIRELEHPGRHRFFLELLGELQNALGIGRGGDDDVYRVIFAAGKWWRHRCKILNTRNRAQFLNHTWQIILRGRLATTPWIKHHSPETITRICQLEGESSIRNVLEDFPGGLGITASIINRGIRWGGHNPKNHTLILNRSEFPGSHVPKESSEERQTRPNGVNGGARPEGA